jgi:hypothetical protein
MNFKTVLFCIKSNTITIQDAPEIKIGLQLETGTETEIQSQEEPKHSEEKLSDATISVQTDTWSGSQTKTTGAYATARECCKEKNVPKFCLGFCKPKTHYLGARSLFSVGKCNDHLPTIKKCITFDHYVVAISNHQNSEGD